MQLTLIGNGFMAQAIAKGLVEKYDIEIIGRDEKKLQDIKKILPQISIKVMQDKEDISDKHIIFCVKPYALQSVSVRLEGKANTLFSILAGTTLKNLKQQIKAQYYIRTMPNVAASISKSTTTITGDREAKNIAMEIFTQIGKTIWVNTENQLDIASAIAGSGPAYLALIAEALSDGAVKAGLERHISNELIQSLFEGFAHLLKDNHPALIKDSVMSPGGTTAAGYFQLEKGNVRSSLMQGVQSAYDKAIEIGNT